MKNQNTNWATLLREAVTTKDNLPLGEGWTTTKKLAEENGFSLTKVQRRMAILLKEGRVEKFEGVQDGKLNFWYREINSMKKNKRQLNDVIL